MGGVSMVRPIQGAQVVPPIPNNVQAECICVPKVYDFVVFTEDINTTVQLPTPPPVGCPITVTDIDCALVTESFFPLACETNGVCTILDRRPVNFDGVNASLVKLRQDIPVDVTFTGTDVAGNAASCTIRVLVPFIRQVVLCFPPEFTNDNLICRIISGDCTVITPPPNVGQPFPTSVGLELLVCKEVQVVAAVKLEVLAKFCSPRSPIGVPIASICPPTLFPQQCDFFPQPNCLCRGSVQNTSDNGLITINATTCGSCALINSSITFIAPDPFDPNGGNFTFTASTFDTETCTDIEAGTQQVITGTGIFRRDNGTSVEVSYILILNEGLMDFYSLSIMSPTFGIGISRNVPDGNLVVERCTQFPTPV